MCQKPLLRARAVVSAEHPHQAGPTVELLRDAGGGAGPAGPPELPR